MKTYVILLSIITGVILNSCGDIINSEQNINKTRIVKLSSEDVIMPLRVGNSWTYHLRFSDSTLFASNDVFTRSLTGDTISNNEVWNIMLPFYYRNKSDGLHVTTVPGWYLDYNDALYAKYPAAKGDTFSYNNMNCKVLSTDTTITVPAGTFTCFLYQKTMSTPDSTIYYTNNQFYCPNIGLIKEEYYTFDNSKDMMSIYELNDYKLR